MNKQTFNFAIIFFVFLLSSSTSKAQIKRPHLYFGAAASYFNPRGSFAEQYKFGVGGELSAGIGSNKTLLVGTVGKSIFLAENKNGNGNISYKPMKVGIRQFLLSKKLFVQGDLGFASVKDKTMSSSENMFLRDIGAGVRILGLEGGIYYSGWKSINTSGFSNSAQVKIGWSKLL